MAERPSPPEHAEPTRTARDEDAPAASAARDDSTETSPDLGRDAAANDDQRTVDQDLLTIVENSGTAIPLNDPQHQGSLGRVGQYEVLEIIGRGGMGVVLRAFDEGLHRNVAIKVMSRHMIASDSARKRFIREARSAAGINHPNVVTIHAVSEQDGVPFLVMEYVDGCTLRERIEADAPMEIGDILRISSQICDGLEAAHRHGVVHRDIKPSNVLLENGVERVKITDFGLARLVEEHSDLTSLGDMVGTPAYMSPEQVSGAPLDCRSDLFSLGCVIYAMVAGHSPFRGNSAIATVRLVKDEPHRPLQDAAPDAPGYLAEIIDRLLQKRPEDRFASATELGEVLRRHLAHANQRRSGETTVVDSPGPPSRRAGKLVAGGIAGLAAIVLTFILWPHSGTDRRDDPQGPPSDGAPATTQPSGAGAADSGPPGEYAAIAAPFQWWSFVDFIDEARAVCGGGYFGGEGAEYPLVVWRLSDGGVEQQLSGPTSWVWCGDVSPDRRYVLAATGPSPIGRDGVRPGGVASDVFVWDLDTGELVSRFQGHGDTVRAAAFLADGARVVSGGYDGALLLWRTETADEVHQFENFGGEVLSAAASPDGRWIASGHWNVVEIWDAETLEWAHQVEATGVLALAFSPDARHLAIGGGDGRVQVIDLDAADGTPPQSVARFAAHQGRISSLAWTEENRLVSGSDEDNSLRMWDPFADDQVPEFQQSHHEVKNIAVSAGGRRVLAACADGSVQSWELPPGRDD